MIRGIFIFISLILFVATTPVYAGVVINEVAWMGTENSAQDEWIELYSDGNQNLDGWTLVTDDGGMSINLSGIINGYYLIERTDDTTVPDVTADLVTVFGNGLNNNGEILILRDAGGNEVDRVDGMSSWSIGGNALAKETLQKTSGGWITAAATPKAQNADAQSSPEENNSSETNSLTHSQSGEAVVMAESVSKIKTSAGADRTVLAGAEAVFNGSAEGFVDATADKIRFYWNFGDGKTGEGGKVAHVFSFPGAYEVFLTVSFAGVSASDSVKITAIENPVVVSEIKYGKWVEISNASARKIDFSGFGLSLAGAKSFYFHEGTFLSPWAYLALEPELLGFEIPQSGEIKIVYPNGKVLLSLMYPAVALDEKESLSLINGEWVKSKATPGTKNEVLKTKAVSSPGGKKPGFLAVSKPGFEESGDAKKEATEINLASVSSPGVYIWLFSGLGAGILGGLALFFVKRYRA